MNVLRAAVESMKGESGFAPMGKIGQYISNPPSLSSKNFGYTKWSDLIRATEYFEESQGENQQVAFGEQESQRLARDYESLETATIPQENGVDNLRVG